MRFPTTLALPALLLGAAALGCTAKVPEADPTVFVAQQQNFQDFEGWPVSGPAYPAPTLPPLDGGDGIDASRAAVDGGVDASAVHTEPLMVYLNMKPPSGSTSFPLATIIVKETTEVDPTARKVFAMVKRGGDYNPNGAKNWEWFELQYLADGSVQISWRGPGPLAGSTDPYAANPNICNECHLRAAANDDVWSEKLLLSNF
jgi:hypothetical protein